MNKKQWEQQLSEFCDNEENHCACLECEGNLMEYKLKDFISILLKDQRQSIIEIIKKKAHKDKDCGTLEEPACGVNQTLKEIIKQIK